MRRAFALALLLTGFMLINLPTAAQTTFTVTNISDSGAGSLRQAIEDANANSGADVIAFNIPGAGPHTIAPASPLPAIVDPVVLDGYTQPGAAVNTDSDGFNGTLLIELSGANAGTDADGIVLTSDESIVRGLVINRFTRDGINVAGDENVVEGNFIGTNTAGTAALPNGDDGVDIDTSDNLIGGTAASARNIISGNGDRGVAIGGGATLNRVQGNFIGTTAVGTTPLGNVSNGVSVFGTSGTIIGGPATGARNVISGNADAGIFIFGSSSSNTVQGNYIGTDGTGTIDVGNGGHGVLIEESLNSMIGGTAGAGNLISGNDDDGIFIRGASTVTNALIQGNLIGTQADGISPLGNAGDGIDFSSSSPASGNTVGGASVGEGNVVAFNGARGVFVSGGTGNALRGNTVFMNAELGMDIGAPAGRTLNDPGDGDAGPNNLQNFPEVASATGDNASTLTIDYAVPSATANSAYPLTVEFFLADADNEEGQRFIGSDTYEAAEAEQQASIAFTPVGAVNDGDRLVATATDAAGNTSEFSDPTEVVGSAVMVEPGAEQPIGFTLSLAAPNPFSEATMLTVSLPEGERVTVEVYDALGRRVAVLHDGDLAVGSHSLRFEAAGLPSGLYLIRAHGDDRTLTRRVMRLH